MNTATLIYVCSISLQLAGALLLMLNAVSANRQKVIQRFAGSRGIIIRDRNTNKISYNKESFKNCFRDVYLYKWSFSYIALGYLLSIFGVNDYGDHLLILMLVITCSIFLMFTTCFTVKQIVAHSKKINKEITDGELHEAGIAPDMQSISNAEIDEILKGIE